MIPKRGEFGEPWRPVVGAEGFYEVSSVGAVRRVGACRGGTPGRILAACSNPAGYPFVILYCNREKRTVMVHQLVAEAFIGPRPRGQQVNHKNGVKDDPRAENLEYVTPQGNMDHAKRMGLTNRGERNGASKLTDGDIVVIRNRAKDGESSSEIAATFGINRRQISMIIARKRWAHVA